MKHLNKIFFLFIIFLSLKAQSQVSGTFTRYVSTGSDDAEQRISTGAMDLTSSDLEITTDGSNNQLIGIRFSGVSIPKGVIIDSAFIQFATNGDKAPVSGAATIRAELAANSATFAATINDISSRTLSSSFVTWAGSTDATWGTCCANNRGPAQKTPNIAALVQTAINQASWNTGNAVTFILNGSGVRNARSFNGSATFAPQLIVYYTQNTFSPLAFPLTAGSVWKFRDNGVYPGATWTSSSYNDSTWAFKSAKFGYGDPATTTVSFGNDSNNKHVTTWFRTQFNMTNTAGFDTLIFKLLRDDGAVVYLNGLEVFRRNMPAGIITDSTLALTDVNGAAETTFEEIRIPNTLVNGINTLAVEIHQVSKQSNDKGFDLEVSAKRVAMTVVNFPVAKNSEWYYLDNGSDQGTAWRSPSFYDGNWNYGPGILGYGDPSATTLGFGPNSSNKYITSYFRKHFNVSNIAAIADSLVFSIMRDDGAVVYLNGVEIFKTNMPDTGTINYLTWAASIVDGAFERTYYDFYIPKTLLINGQNTLAVELHQRDGTSSDITFDMEVKQDPRTLNFTNPTASQSAAAGQNLAINWYNVPSINRVKIELSTDNRATWTTIANNRLASDKPFAYGLPNINSSVSWLRITDSTGLYKDSVTFWIYPVPASFNPCVDSLHIGCFASVPQARNQILKQPSNHTFQQIGRQGQTHNLGGTVGSNLDFTGFVSSNGSSKNGILGVNEENTPGGVSVFYLTFKDTLGTWVRDSSGKVVTTDPGVVQFTRNCSGGVTPWGTIITAEESFNAGDVNADGYQDVGWLVEYSPVTRRVMDYNSDGIRDKLWAMGRMNHENVVLKNDSLTAYYGEDGGTSCVYKFVAFQKTRMDSGTLYVLQRNGSIGTWVLVSNQTQTQRNTIPSIASGLGGTNFNGVEDVEISPINGMIYFTSKNNARIYRFTDNGSTVSNFEDYVGNASVNYTMNVEGGGTQSANWGSGIDNLSFDNLGNLWAQQDGGNGHIWVIRPDHTPFAPKVDIYATTPSGSESSGLTFTPDNRFGFLSIMGASSTNTTSALDAAGNSVIFNVSNTVIIANKKFLGAMAAVPVEFYDFYLKAKGEDAVMLNWSTASEINNKHFLVERSMDGINYQTIAAVAGAGNSTTVKSYSYLDAGLAIGTYYYRLKQVDFDGKYSYSSVRIIRLGAGVAASVQIFPVPFQNVIHIGLNQEFASPTLVRLLDLNGKVLVQQNFIGVDGDNLFKLEVSQVPAGSYVIEVSYGEEKISEVIVK